MGGKLNRASDLDRRQSEAWLRGRAERDRLERERKERLRRELQDQDRMMREVKDFEARLNEATNFGSFRDVGFTTEDEWYRRQGCGCELCRAQAKIKPSPRPGSQQSNGPCPNCDANSRKIAELTSKVSAMEKMMKEMQETQKRMLDMVTLIAGDLEFSLEIEEPEQLTAEIVEKLAEASGDMRAYRIGAEREARELDEEANNLAEAYEAAVIDLAYWREKFSEVATGAAA